MAKRLALPAIMVVLLLTVALTVSTSVHGCLGLMTLSWMHVRLEGNLPFVPPPKLPPWEQVAQRHPNDWRAQHAWADLPQDAEASIARYDQVIARFPDKAALHAGRVRRYAQLILFTRPEESWLYGETTSAFSPPKHPADFEHAIAAAHEGMKVESDNAFYNYMLAGFLFGLRRDEEALSHILEGARKPCYDSHVHDGRLNGIHLDRLSQGTPLSKFAISLFLLPPVLDCPKERQVARLVTWYGTQAEKQGKHALALKRYEQVLRMGEQLMDEDHSLAHVLTGSSVTMIALKRSDKRLFSSGSPSADEAAVRKRVQRFADYAIDHKRADLAAVAWRQFEKAQMVREWGNHFTEMTTHHARVGRIYAPLDGYMRIATAQVALLIQATVALLAAVITALLARRFREQHEVAWQTAFYVAMTCWLPATFILAFCCKWAPGSLEILSACLCEDSDRFYVPTPLLCVVIFLPFLFEDFGWGVRKTWLRLRGMRDVETQPLLPRTCVALALLSLIAYAVLLIPLHRAGQQAHIYTERLATNDVELAHEAMKWAASSNHQP